MTGEPSPPPLAAQCTEAGRPGWDDQLTLYADGELPTADSLLIEAHLDRCAVCARKLQVLAALRQALRKRAPYFRAEAATRARLQAREQEGLMSAEDLPSMPGPSLRAGQSRSDQSRSGPSLPASSLPASPLLKSSRAAPSGSASSIDTPSVTTVSAVSEQTQARAGREGSLSHRALWRRWSLPLAASLAVLVLGNWGINEWRLGRAWPHASATQSAMLRLDDELFNAHQRALLLNQLIAVPSSDQHTVKPWFAGRVDYSPPVPDLVADGFILQGGRLDYIDHRKVAVLIYQRRLHMIDVFVWPSAENDNAAASQPNTPSGSPARIDELALSDIHTQQGYQRLCWRFAAMHYCAVSDLNGGELEQFARLLTQRISTSAAAPA